MRPVSECGLDYAAGPQAESSLPRCALSLCDAFAQHPCFPPNVKVEYARYRRYSRAYVKGSSEWGSPLAGCRHEMPPFRQPVDITVTTKKPIPLSIQSDHKDNHISTRISPQNQDYVSILTLAWVYVLSARWAELLGGQCSITYADAQAPEVDGARVGPHGTPTFEVSLGSHSLEEARWWTAVLAPGRGWSATMIMDKDELLAPWSISLERSPVFTLSGQLELQSSLSTQNHAASSIQAFRFLDKLCQLHGIEDQSLAALASALLLPSLQGTQILTLPAPSFSPERHGTEFMSTSSSATSPGHRRLQHIIKHQHLDRLLTLSCHTRGIDCGLLSVFFNPDIKCNEAGPWLQGALDVISPMVVDEPWVLGLMLMNRSPEVAPLWLGATILGLQEKLVWQVGFGQIPMDLNAAAWSNTVQSFIQLPVSYPSQRIEYISPADECRLLFLAQADAHTQAPFCQWAPFGVTSIDEADVEVRLHKDCNGHILQYRGFVWDSSYFHGQMPALSAVYNARRFDENIEPYEQERDFVTPEDLDHSKEFISEVATRSIFNWLRPDGCTSQERELWMHNWLDMPQSDEDEEIEDGESGKKPAHVQSWIEGLKVDLHPEI
ncbi:hypothetical protein NM208_g2474 [Fusarium decemcellulare]|uniref:Uncharacterized protein n=1 Tax=Fusarium decemcellulare TaxID=57161 RepID=A0ACC1SSB8_9HYPO|nr:hypothetical protein NM208_g2474 [Fusarium decemcellulare]